MVSFDLDLVLLVITVFIRYFAYPPTQAIALGCVITHLLNPKFEKMASSLGVNELGKLLSEHSKYQVKWYDIGLQLEIEEYVLDTIRYDCQNKIGACFRDMLAHWLKNDKSATEFRLQRAIEVCMENKLQQRSLTKSFPFPVNRYQWYKAIILILIGMMASYMAFYYQHNSSPVTNTAETLKNQYRDHYVMKFNLLNISNMEYLGMVMKDTNRHEFGYSKLVQTYTGKGGRLIITGLPGSGKTTLLRHLAKEWANGRAFPNCCIVFLISLGSLRGEVNTLSDLLIKTGFGDLKNLKDLSENIYATNGAEAYF